MILLLAMLAAEDAHRIQYNGRPGAGKNMRSLTSLTAVSGDGAAKPLRLLAKLLVAYNPTTSNGSVTSRGSSRAVSGVRGFLAGSLRLLGNAVKAVMCASGLLLIVGMVTGEFRTFCKRVEEDVEEFLDEQMASILRQSRKGNVIERLFAAIFAPFLVIVMLPILFPIALFTSIIYRVAESLLRMLPALATSAVVLALLPAPKRAVTTSVLRYTGIVFWIGMILAAGAATLKDSHS